MSKQAEGPKWLAEFGSEYKVPIGFMVARDVADKSYCNDACPSFWVGPMLWGKYRVQIWVDHPEKSQWEYPRSNDVPGAQEGRFVLTLAEVDASGESYTDGVSMLIGTDTEAESVLARARNLFLVHQTRDEALAFLRMHIDHTAVELGRMSKAQFLKLWFAVDTAIGLPHPDAGEWYLDGPDAFSEAEPAMAWLGRVHREGWPIALSNIYAAMWARTDLEDFERYPIDTRNIPV